MATEAVKKYWREKKRAYRAQKKKEAEKNE
jgi:hypothetical protein